MNYAPGFAYQEQAVEGASPVGLVVIMYGGIVASLLRAKDAVRKQDIERRVRELNKVLKIIAQLQGTLDHERGGQVAANLERFYVVMRSRVLEASVKQSEEVLDQLVRHFTLLKEAWQTVENSVMMTGMNTNNGPNGFQAGAEM